MIKFSGKISFGCLWAFFFLVGFGPEIARAETVESGVLMRGTTAQTAFYVKSGAENGPTIVVIGGLHGDEPAGYLAARQLKNWTVTRGTLVLVPDANVLAIRRNARFYRRNINRLFPGKMNGDAMETLAFELWQLIKNSRPALVVTLHESRGFHALEPLRYGQTFTYDFPELTPRFAPILERLNAGIPEKKHRFSLFVAPFATCPTFVTWKYLRVPATSIETARPLPLPQRVGFQLAALREFFKEFGLGTQETALPPSASKP